MDKIIEEAINFAKEIFKDDFSGHDFYHSMRVYKTAVEIGKTENADLKTVSLAALLHDVDDVKISPETSIKKERTIEFLRKNLVHDTEIDAIINIINEVSFAGTDTVSCSTIEGKCVQDADRIDALGAIGIARTFAYGGSHNRTIYDPNIPPNITMNKNEYLDCKSTSINHFYEKLFLLEGMMNTETGKQIAKRRTEFMKHFVNEFIDEWNGFGK